MQKIILDSFQVFGNCDFSKFHFVDICLSDNPRTGLFLKENPHLIDKYYLNKNKNDWAIDFLIENNMNISYDNTHDKAVDYLIKNKIEKYLYLLNNDNKNELNNYFRQNKDLSYCGYFSSNTNDKAVDYIIKNIDTFGKINYFIHNLEKNENIKIVNYILNQDIDIKSKMKKLISNKNDKAVDFILENIELIDSDNLYDFLENDNNNDNLINFIIKSIQDEKDYCIIASSYFKEALLKKSNKIAKEFIKNNPEYFKNN